MNTQTDQDVEDGKYDFVIQTLATEYKVAKDVIRACNRCSRLIQAGKLESAQLSALRSLFKLGIEARARLAK
jgi:hypothetical protein